MSSYYQIVIVTRNTHPSLPGCPVFEWLLYTVSVVMTTHHQQCLRSELQFRLNVQCNKLNKEWPDHMAERSKAP